MPRRSHRRSQGGRSAEFLDDDDQYEGHAAARERNSEVYGGIVRDFNDLSLNKGSRARRTEKAKAAKAGALLERDYVMVDYLKHYKFVETTVNNLLILYSKVLCTHTSLKAMALRTMVNTQIERIESIMHALPDLEYAQKTRPPGDMMMVAMERDIHQKYKSFIKKMSQIAALVQQLHPHLDLWYTQEGREFSDGNIWRAFDTSCSKIPENFPNETEKTKRVSKLSNLLTQLQDLDTMLLM